MDRLTLKQNRKVFSAIGWGFFTLITVSAVIQVAGVLLVSRFLPGFTSSPWYIWLMTYVPMYGIGVPLCILIVTRVPRVYLNGGKLGFGTLCLCFAFSFTMLYGGNLVGVGVTSLLSLFKGNATGNPLETLIGGQSIWLTALFAVVLAPPIEEFLCRKLLIDRLAPFGDAAAIVVSAAVFGLMHGNFSQCFYAFGIGLVFGYVYIRSGKIHYTIIMHAIINFMGSVLSQILVDGVDLDALTEFSAGGDVSQVLKSLPGLMSLAGYGMLMIGVAILGLVLFLVFRKRMVLNRGEYALRGRRFKTVILNSGAIAFIASSAALFAVNTFM